MEACTALTTYSNDEAEQCTLPVTLQEDTQGPLPALPGCNPVTSGPEPAAEIKPCPADANVQNTGPAQGPITGNGTGPPPSGPSPPSVPTTSSASPPSSSLSTYTATSTTSATSPSTPYAVSTLGEDNTNSTTNNSSSSSSSSDDTDNNNANNLNSLNKLNNENMASMDKMNTDNLNALNSMNSYDSTSHKHKHRRRSAEPEPEPDAPSANPGQQKRAESLPEQQMGAEEVVPTPRVKRFGPWHHQPRLLRTGRFKSRTSYQDLALQFPQIPERGVVGSNLAWVEEAGTYVEDAVKPEGGEGQEQGGGEDDDEEDEEEGEEEGE